MAISTRFRTPSLAIRLVMCVLTVLSVMCSSAAISLLVRPRATVARICSSRSVSGSMGCATGEAGADDLLVVGDDHPDAHRAHPARGSTAVTVQPRSGSGPALQVPPSSLA